jgi:hypothetical protein
MTARDPNSEGATTERDRDEGGEEGVDFDAVKDKLGYLWRSRKRRPRLAMVLFVLIAALGITVAMTMPRVHRAEVKLGAQHENVTQQLSNPTPGLGGEHQTNDPSRDAANQIIRRDNLIALVRESNLVERWRATRSAPLRFKDWVLRLGSAPPTDEEEELVLAQTLEKKLTVWADDSSVTIDVDWNDPQMAYELATLVQKNFVEARYDTDIAMIQDAIKLLEDHAKAGAQEVDAALAAYLALEASSGSPSPAGGTPSPLPPRGGGAAGGGPAATAPPPVAAPDPDLTKALEEKRRQIRALEDERQRERDGLKQQLVQAQLTLTPLHPTVIALQQQLDALSKPSPELEQLRAQERALMAQIAPPLAPSGSAAIPPAPPRMAPLPGAPQPPPLAPLAARPRLPAKEDPALAPARSKLEAAIHGYQDVMARLDGARLELDITRTAFRYRYTVITPAEVPRRTKKPITELVTIGSLLAAALLALLGSAAADWRSGRVIETWQVRRRLKLEILGELDGPHS